MKSDQSLRMKLQLSVYEHLIIVPLSLKMVILIGLEHKKQQNKRHLIVLLSLNKTLKYQDGEEIEDR